MHQIGLDFTSQPAEIQEDLSFSAFPLDLVQNIALEKAQHVAHSLDEGLVIAADTVVVLAGQVMGKPRDREEARAMLASLSDQRHQVITGLCIIDVDSGRWETGAETTWVCFRSLYPTEIEAYLDYAEWEDKAGAYAIQGRGALLVDSIDGCYFNVVGLPLNRLHLMLRKYGVDLLGG